MRKHFKILLSWIFKLFEGYNDHELWDEWLDNLDNNKCIQSCNNCRFKNHYGDRCWVGTFYASKGQNAICYEGELWKSKVSDKTKTLKLLA